MTEEGTLYYVSDEEREEVRTTAIPPHTLSFDEKEFLELLAGSISLSKEEKFTLIAKIPSLSQEQVDELIAIFTEERDRFKELNKEYAHLKEEEAQKEAASSIDW